MSITLTVRGNSGISMVILDVNMPRMNGLEMLEELNKSGHMATLPVLMVH